MPTFNEMLQTATKGINDVAKQLTSSAYFQDVVPGKDRFAEELAHGIGSNKKLKIQHFQDNIDKKINSMSQMPLKVSGLNKEEAESVSEELVKALHGTDYSDEDFKKLGEIMRKHNVSDKIIDTFSLDVSESVNKILSRDISEKTLPTMNDFMKHPKLYAQTYFNNPDAKVRQRRITAVAGTYATVTVGGRLLSGGTLTEDNYGRRDIAGIPFI